jgi:hypothetical protein
MPKAGNLIDANRSDPKGPHAHYPTRPPSPPTGRRSPSSYGTPRPPPSTTTFSPTGPRTRRTYRSRMGPGPNFNLQRRSSAVDPAWRPIDERPVPLSPIQDSLDLRSVPLAPSGWLCRNSVFSESGTGCAFNYPPSLDEGFLPTNSAEEPEILSLDGPTSFAVFPGCWGDDKL